MSRDLRGQVESRTQKARYYIVVCQNQASIGRASHQKEGPKLEGERVRNSVCLFQSSNTTMPPINCTLLGLQQRKTHVSLYKAPSMQAWRIKLAFLLSYGLILPIACTDAPFTHSFIVLKGPFLSPPAQATGPYTHIPHIASHLWARYVGVASPLASFLSSGPP